MATAVQLELQGDSGNFTFTLDGPYFPRLEGDYRAGNPRKLVALREVWEIRGARITGADPTATWAAWVAFRTRIAKGGTTASEFPDYVRFRIPGGAILHTLGPATHEDFLVEVVDGNPTDLTEEERPGAFRTVIPVTLRVSAVQKFSDTNGIVGWEQEVSSRYPEGRHELEWRTRITTREGTSAVTKAQSYAAINVASLGGTYLYETNGQSGVDTEVLDGDEQNSRTPTVVLAVSRVRAFGVTIGTVTAGSAPSDVSYSITTRTTAEEQVTTTIATARGPNALQFVMGKRPTVYNEEEIVDEQAKMFASGTWSQREESNTSGGGQKDGKTRQKLLTAVVKGGGRVFDFEMLADGEAPIQFESAGKLPVVGTVTVRLESIGPSFGMQEMLLPGDPGHEWVLDTEASDEGEPTLAEEGATSSANKWTREARLVWRRATAPNAGDSLLTRVRAAERVASHLYG